MPPSTNLAVIAVKKLYGKSASASSYFVVDNGLAFRAIDFNFSNLNFENIANSKLKCFNKQFIYLLPTLYTRVYLGGALGKSRARVHPK